MKTPTVLIILDGWGIGEAEHTNAVHAANTPNYDRIISEYPTGQLAAHGAAVGLPLAQMGNSEVGHTTIGAGRVVWMDLPKIDRAIKSGELADNVALKTTFEKLKKTGGRAHIMGLASSGGVHAHERHIAALAQAALDSGIPVALHLFTDGRDVAPKAAADNLPKWLATLPDDANIATLSGRFYAMDRDNRWERVEAVYQAIVKGEGRKARDAMDALGQGYDADESDEFITPSIIGGYQGAQDGDAVIFANFRADRAREILAALGAPDFSGFSRQAPKWADMLGMVNYSDQHDEYMNVIFPKERISNTIGEVVASKGLTQFRLAETEKYPHVTFFMNGGEEKPNKGEERYMAPSPKVRTYDLKPEMSAVEVGDQLEAAIRSGDYDLIICNFANPDMVGHTGDLNAAIAAVEAVDHELGRAVRAIEERAGNMIVTADHGNCEVMVDPETGGAHTAHTLNPVSYTVIGHDGKVKAKGGLADLAPSLLALMGITPPEEMTGICLLD